MSFTSGGWLFSKIKKVLEFKDKTSYVFFSPDLGRLVIFQDKKVLEFEEKTSFVRLC